jgi:hypothetical protein
MKLFAFSAILLTVLGTAPLWGGIFGYINITFQPGYNLFIAPLDNQAGNKVRDVIPAAPDGTEISTWNPVTRTYTSIADYWSLDPNGWSVNISLPVGQGFRLWAPSSFTNAFAGVLLNPDGSPFVGQDQLPLPTFTSPPGVYLIACKFPATYLPNYGLTVFKAVIGRDPNNGEQFTWLDPSTQQAHSTVFRNGAWNNGEPILAMGQAAFFTTVCRPGDLNNDCKVDLHDVAYFVRNWLTTCLMDPSVPLTGDLNGDCRVDLADFALLASD